MKNPEMGFNPNSIEQSDTPAKGQESWWQELYDRYSAQFKKSIVKTITVGLMLQFSHFEAHKVYGSQLENDRSEISKTEERSEAQVRKDLSTDRYERLFIEINNQMYEFQGVGSERTIFLKFTDIEQFLKIHPGFESNIAITHTHPVATYEKVFELLGVPLEKREAMLQSGQVPEQPPSMMDFISQYQTQEYFENKGISVTGKAIDPESTWEYSIDPQSKFIPSILKSQQDLSDSLSEQLSPKDWQLITDLLSDKSDPRFIEEALAKDSGNKELDKDKQRIAKILRDSEDRIQSQSIEAWQTYDMIEKLAVKVVGAETINDRRVAITEYITYCKRFGIVVQVE